MSISTSPFDIETPLPRLRSISQLWRFAAVLSGVGVAAMVLDMPVARAVKAGMVPSELSKLIDLCEVFGHGWGVLFIVACIAVLDPWHRYAIPRIILASLGSGLLANTFKLVLSRARPHSYDLQGSSLDSFLEWFPLVGSPSSQQGFPSSHTATAAGLAIVLAYVYPRGRWLFPIFAVLAAGQRLIEQYHFVSDAFWGAAVGCVFAPLCVYGSGLARGFDRLEDRLMSRPWVSGAGKASKGFTIVDDADRDFRRAA